MHGPRVLHIRCHTQEMLETLSIKMDIEILSPTTAINDHGLEPDGLQMRHRLVR